MNRDLLSQARVERGRKAICTCLLVGDLPQGPPPLPKEGCQALGRRELRCLASLGGGEPHPTGSVGQVHRVGVAEGAGQVAPGGHATSGLGGGGVLGRGDELDPPEGDRFPPRRLRRRFLPLASRHNFGHAGALLLLLPLAHCPFRKKNHSWLLVEQQETQQGKAGSENDNCRGPVQMRQQGLIGIQISF